jgi:RNA polymerase sigma factor for flagellar operon FliA
MVHIRGAVMDELRRMDWMSRGGREKAKKLKEVVSIVEQRLGRAATEEEMCAELCISPDKYAELLDEVKPLTFVALDGEAYSEDSDSISLHEMISDEGQVTACDTLAKKELVEILTERIESLPEVPRKVLAMYYFENMRIAEIAAVFGVTEGRISQIHTQAVLSLRTFMEGVLKNTFTPSCG